MSDFFRGCRSSEQVDRSETPILKSNTKTFYPDIRRLRSSDTVAAASIQWNDDAEALPSLIARERSKPDFGIISRGVSHVDSVGATELIEKCGLSEFVTLDHEDDPESPNPYHGNILFNTNFCTIRKDEILKPNKPNLNRICNCFVLSEKRFIQRSEYDSGSSLPDQDLRL